VARPDLTREVLNSLDVSHLSSYIRQGLSVTVRILLPCTGVGMGVQTADHGPVSVCRRLLRDVAFHTSNREVGVGGYLADAHGILLSLLARELLHGQLVERGAHEVLSSEGCHQLSLGLPQDHVRVDVPGM